MTTLYASVGRFLADKEMLTSIGDHGKLEVEIAPPVRLLAEADLPPDHVVRDITPEMLAEGNGNCLLSPSEPFIPFLSYELFVHSNVLILF